jgi:NAD(P)-dependent dehydrogenase (short-subunit alcohol dehydrogenase family)
MRIILSSLTATASAVVAITLWSTTATDAWVISRRAALQTATVGATSAVVLTSGPLISMASGIDKDLEYYTPAAKSLTGQTIVITGGSTGLGLESAKRLAAGGANIIVTARSDAKGQAAVQAVQEYLQEQSIVNDKIGYKVLDLDNLQGIQNAVAKNWKDVDKIDVLMNNAGIMAVSNRELTVDGVERQIQSNHLGHFVLTSLLTRKFTDTARIINVSSEGHKFAAGKGIEFDYLWKGEPGYGPWKSYGQSKLANILFTQELQRRAEASGRKWQVASLHPGAVATDLSRNLVGVEEWEKLKSGNGSFIQVTFIKLLNNFVKTVPQGATTQVYLAAMTSPGAAGHLDPQGRYYIDCKPVDLPAFATGKMEAQRLWKESEQIAGIKFEIPSTVPVAETFLVE